MIFTHKLEIFEIELEQEFASLSACQIQIIHSQDQSERAVESLASFIPTVDDATIGAKFWTADEKLIRQVRDKLAFVQWLSPVS